MTRRRALGAFLLVLAAWVYFAGFGPALAFLVGFGAGVTTVLALWVLAKMREREDQDRRSIRSPWSRPEAYRGGPKVGTRSKL